MENNQNVNWCIDQVSSTWRVKFLHTYSACGMRVSQCQNLETSSKTKVNNRQRESSCRGDWRCPDSRWPPRSKIKGSLYKESRVNFKVPLHCEAEIGKVLYHAAETYHHQQKNTEGRMVVSFSKRLDLISKRQGDCADNIPHLAPRQVDGMYLFQFSASQATYQLMWSKTKVPPRKSRLAKSKSSIWWLNSMDRWIDITTQAISSLLWLW